jgi:hypothetical protein
LSALTATGLSMVCCSLNWNALEIENACYSLKTARYLTPRP